MNFVIYMEKNYMKSISDIISSIIENIFSNNTQGIFSMFPIIILFVLFMYFLVVRPQSQKMKEYKKLIENIRVNDEIVTNGGLIGKVKKITHDLIVVNVAKDVEIIIQKSAVSNLVPRGTMESI